MFPQGTSANLYIRKLVYIIYISNKDYPLRCNPVSKLLETGRIDLQTFENRLN